MKIMALILVSASFCSIGFGADAVLSAAPTNALPIPPLAEKQVHQLTFGLDQVPNLRRQLFGFELWQYLATLFYVFLAVVAARFLDYLVSVQLKKWTSKSASHLDDLLIALAHGPVKIISLVIILHFGLELFLWPAWIESWISRGLQLAVACFLTYVLLKLVDLVAAHFRRRVAAREDKNFNDQLFPVISRTAKTFIVIIAFLVTAQNLGLNITGVLASLSIGGLALGLAAQDTVANLFGAVAVFADKPFRIGDFVKLDQIEGTVETIGLRSTRIRNPDGHLITVPNKTMGNATIINVTERPSIRTILDIGLAYDTPPAKVQRAVQILTETYRSDPRTKDLVVGFNQFAPMVLNIRVIHWWDGRDFKPYMAGLQELNLKVQQRFEEEKIPLGMAPFLPVPPRNPPTVESTVGVQNALAGRPSAERL